MNTDAVRAKFGGEYVATEGTFIMGIDRRFTERIAERFRNRMVLETCTGAGFTTIALARVAKQVVTVEIDPVHQQQARQNVDKAGLSNAVTFVLGDVLDEAIWAQLPPRAAAFLDPDWAITGPDHVHHFVQSTTRPPADALLERVLRVTANVALVLPAQLDTRELGGLPPHELQSLWLCGSHELYCLYFGELAMCRGHSVLQV